jgi:type II secretion system protein C
MNGFFTVSCLLALVIEAGIFSGPSMAAGQDAQDAEEASSEPELILEGVIVASKPSNAVALVRRPESTFARAVKVGETVYGFELIEVSDGAVRLRQGDAVIRLTLAGQWQRSTTPVVAAANLSEQIETPEAEDGQAPELSAEIKRQLQRSLLEERLSREMPVILTKTGLTPRVEEGVVTGFRITRLPKGTVLDEAGIQAGDVLLSINEISLNSPYALMELYPRLQEADEIRVFLERDGEAMTLVYSFD